MSYLGHPMAQAPARLTSWHGELRKADVYEKGITGWTPLYLAKQKNHADIVQLLLQHGGHE